VNQTDNAELKTLFDSVHSMPNSIFAMVGSSVVVFLANLFFGQSTTKITKSCPTLITQIKLS
jgi:hypothetical protein